MKLKTVILSLLMLTLTSCTNTDKSKHLLEANGYKNIQMTGYSYFGCGDGGDEIFHDGFTATTQNGQTVTGVVCSGWYKGSTIRFD